MERRRSGLILALAGVLVGVVILVPRAVPFERVVGEDVAPELPRLLVARADPADARYEPENESTLIVFQCGHFECRTAARVEGDARDLVGRSHVLLLTRPQRHAAVALDRPFGALAALPSGIEPRVVEPAFRALPFWPLALLAPAAAVALVASAGWARGGRELAARIGGGAAVGVAFAAAGLWTMRGDAAFFVFVFAALASVNALLALVLVRRRKWPKPFASFALALDAALWWLSPWLPSAPSL